MHGSTIKNKQVKKQCDSCDYKSHNKSDLQSHVNFNHKGDTFQCDKCPEFFLRKINLDRHIKLHVWEKCDYCNHVSKENEDLSNHIRSTHGGVRKLFFRRPKSQF